MMYYRKTITFLLTFVFIINLSQNFLHARTNTLHPETFFNNRGQKILHVVIYFINDIQVLKRILMENYDKPIIRNSIRECFDINDSYEHQMECIENDEHITDDFKELLKIKLAFEWIEHHIDRQREFEKIPQNVFFFYSGRNREKAEEIMVSLKAKLLDTQFIRFVHEHGLEDLYYLYLDQLIHSYKRKIKLVNSKLVRKKMKESLQIIIGQVVSVVRNSVTESERNFKCLKNVELLYRRHNDSLSDRSFFSLLDDLNDPVFEELEVRKNGRKIRKLVVKAVGLEKYAEYHREHDSNYTGSDLGLRRRAINWPLSSLEKFNLLRDAEKKMSNLDDESLSNEIKYHLSSIAYEVFVYIVTSRKRIRNRKRILRYLLINFASVIKQGILNNINKDFVSNGNLLWTDQETGMSQDMIIGSLRKAGGQKLIQRLGDLVDDDFLAEIALFNIVMFNMQRIRSLTPRDIFNLSGKKNWFFNELGNFCFLAKKRVRSLREKYEKMKKMSQYLTYISRNYESIFGEEFNMIEFVNTFGLKYLYNEWIEYVFEIIRKRRVDILEELLNEHIINFTSESGESFLHVALESMGAKRQKLFRRKYMDIINYFLELNINIFLLYGTYRNSEGVVSFLAMTTDENREELNFNLGGIKSKVEVGLNMAKFIRFGRDFSIQNKLTNSLGYSFVNDFLVEVYRITRDEAGQIMLKYFNSSDHQNSAKLQRTMAKIYKINKFCDDQKDNHYMVFNNKRNLEALLRYVNRIESCLRDFGVSRENLKQEIFFWILDNFNGINRQMRKKVLAGSKRFGNKVMLFDGQEVLRDEDREIFISEALIPSEISERLLVRYGVKDLRIDEMDLYGVDDSIFDSQLDMSSDLLLNIINKVFKRNLPLVPRFGSHLFNAS